MHIQLFRNIPFYLIILALTACGGGGGGSSTSNTDVPTEAAILLLQEDIRSRMNDTLNFSAQTVLDLDNDNDTDVVAAFSDTYGSIYGTIVFYRNIDNTNFIAEEGPIGFFRTPVVEDFNNDGLDDLFFGDEGYDRQPFSGGQDQLFLQNSEGKLVEKTATNLPPISDISHGACSGDIDGNGFVDIVTNAGDNHKFMLNNDSIYTKDDSIAPEFTSSYSSNGMVYWSCNTGDFNNDGFIDVVLGPNIEVGPIIDIEGNSITSSTTILYGNSSGTLDYFFPESLLPTTRNNVKTVAVTALAHDFNNDGCLDAAMYQTDYITIHGVDILYGDCAMGFTKKYYSLLAITEDNWWLDNAVVHDINNDGLDDIVYFEDVRKWGNNYASIRVLENHGETGFTVRIAEPSDYDSLPLHVKISFDK